MYRVDGIDKVIENKELLMDELIDILEGDLYTFFNEELDMGGPVNVSGLEYCPSAILKAVDPVAYRCGFNDYVDGVRTDIGYDIDKEQPVIYGFMIDYLEEDNELVEVINNLDDIDNAMELFDELGSEDKQTLFKELILTLEDELGSLDYSSIIETYKENLRDM